jgi:lysophospholipase L1-like esterase
MKIKEKLMLDRAGLEAHGAVNIVIFGDSVSHGAINGYFDYESVYWNRLKRRLHEYRDYMPINMINSAIGGTTATQSLSRLERDVTKHEPDLVIVCFGLNDTHGELSDYLTSLESIFGRCKEIGSDVIFLTPNMMNTYVAEDTPREHYNAAFKTADIQNGGRMDEFIYSAIDLAHRMDVTVCDCYSKWKEMSKTEDTTMLLANRINHPIPQMHALFADGLYELIMK